MSDSRVAVVSRHARILLAYALSGRSWNDLEREEGLEENQIYRWFTDTISSYHVIEEYRLKRKAKKYKRTHPFLRESRLERKVTKAFTGYVTEFTPFLSLKLLRGGLASHANNRGRYLETWKKVAHYISLGSTQYPPGADIIQLIADPTDYVQEGNVLMAVMAARAILHHDDDSIGYVIPNARMLSAIERISEVQRRSTSRFDLQGVLLRFDEFATMMDFIVIDQFYQRQHRITIGAHSEERNLVAEAKAEAIARVSDFNSKWVTHTEPQAKAAFRQAYRGFMDKIINDLLSFNIGAWIAYTNSRYVDRPNLGFVPLDHHSFDNMRAREAIPASGRIRFQVVAQLNGQTYGMYHAYNNYIVRGETLSDETKHAMIEALIQMRDHLQEMFEARLVYYMDLTIIQVQLDGDGKPIPETMRDNLALPHPFKSFMEWCVITLNQLTAPTPEGLFAAEQQKDRTDLVDYGYTNRADTMIFYNLFDIHPVYLLPSLALAKHAEEHVNHHFIRIECLESEAGECLDKALFYRTPTPTKAERTEVIMRCLRHECPVEERLEPIKSVPWIVVSSPSSKFTWNVDACSNTELAELQPWQIDPETTIVLCEKEGHMYRVTEIKKPSHSFLVLNEEIKVGDSSFLRALHARTPYVTTVELAELEKAFSEGKSVWECLQIIKSVPFRLVGEPKRGFRWHQYYSTDEVTCSPDSIDLSQVIVIASVGDSFQRVMSIIPTPELDCKEEFAIEGFLTVHAMAARASNRVLETLADSFRPPQMGEIPMRILREKYAMDNIAQLVKRTRSIEFRRQCYELYISENDELKDMFKDAAELERLLKDSSSELCEAIGIPDVTAVEPQANQTWRVVYPEKDCTLTPMQAVADAAHNIVLCKHKNHYMRVIDYHITLTEGLPFPQYFTARRRLAMTRGDTYEHTIELINPSLMSPEETLLLQADIKNIAQITSCKYAIITGFKCNQQGIIENFEYADKSPAVTDPDFDTDIMLWQDPDGTIFVVTGLCDYDCPSIPSTKQALAPVVISYDFETGNTNMSEGKHQKTKPIILHACITINGTDRARVRFEGDTCANQFAEWLIIQRSQYTKDRKILVVGFNSSKFDMYELMSALVDCPKWKLGFQGYNSQLVKAGSKILELRYENIYFHDVRRFLMMSLKDAARTLGCKAAKSGWNHQHSQEIFSQSRGEPIHFLNKLRELPATDFIGGDEAKDIATLSAYDAYHAYCANDCEVCLEVFLKLHDGYFEMTNGKMDIYDAMTLPQAVNGFCMQSLKDRGIKLHKPRSPAEYLFYRAAILAGRSQVFKTAPKQMGFYDLLMIDETSQYPHKMHQCWYPLDSVVHQVNELVPNKLGIYKIKITKQANPVVIPLKACDSKLGGHFWDYEGEFIVGVTNIHIIDHRYFGGECEVIEGYVFDKMSRGILTPVIELFKNVKQEQDRLKNSGQKFNAAWRQAAKDGSNNLSGKFIQDLNLDKAFLLAHHETREDFIKKMKNKYGDDAVMTMFLSKQPEGNVEEQLAPYSKAMMVEVKKDIASVFSHKGKVQVKSIVTGLFIYAWSQHHMLHAIIARATWAGAPWAIETDGLQFDRVKYEQWMAEYMPDVNPYDVPAPTKEQLPDTIFDMPVKEGDIGLNDRRLGYFYCPIMAKNWALRHNREWYAYRAPDYGDYTVETGAFPILDGKIPRTDDGAAHGGVNTNLVSLEQIECCYIGKKCYYLSKGEEQKAKYRFKGVGQSTKDATELVAFIKAHPGKDLSADTEYLTLLAKIDRAPTILGKKLYERLMAGEGVDVCERRFRGDLAFLGDDGCGLCCDLVIKRLLPPEHMRLLVRTIASERNKHGNSIYEQQYPASYPKGEPPCIIKFQGIQLTRSELDIVMSKFKEMYVNGSEKIGDARGITISLRDKPMYIDAHTMKFIWHNKDYFFSKYEPQ